MAEETSGWTQFAELLLSPLGGAVLGWLWWMWVPKVSPVDGVDFACVDVLGSSICSGWAASGVGAIIAFLVAGIIHIARS